MLEGDAKIPNKCACSAVHAGDLLNKNDQILLYIPFQIIRRST